MGKSFALFLRIRNSMAKKMTYRFLILNTDYGEFIANFYRSHSRLEHKSYAQQLKARMDSLCGLANFYSKNLQKLGFKAWDIIYNHPYLQKQWVDENLPFFHSLRWPKNPHKKDWWDRVLEKQIAVYRPTVIFNMAMESVSSEFLNHLKSKLPFIKLIIGQHAAPVTAAMRDLSSYDVIISSLPHYAEKFVKQKVPCRYLPLGFEARILPSLKKSSQKYGVVHIGGYTPLHKERVSLLEKVAKQVPIDFWGYGTEHLKPDSPILKNYHGQAWGRKRYNLFHNGKIAINKHIFSVANHFANNMTLYETTGSGCLLITDYKVNLGKLFKIGKEIETYRHPKELVGKIKYFLAHDKERERIAKEGQKRTLKEHSYYRRAKSLITIVEEFLSKKND